MTLRMLVPMRTRSPSFRRARLIFSPLTKVPLVEPRSSIEICVVLVGDPRVLARDHVLDEDHVEIARATDDDLLVGDDRKLAALVLPGDESQRKRASGWPEACVASLGRGVMHVDGIADGDASH